MLTFNFDPFPNLESERLLLRAVDDGDVEEVLALRSNPETMKYVPRPLAKTKEDAYVHIRTIKEKISNNSGINWAITIKGNNQLIGIIGHYKLQPENYRAEIGYMLSPEYKSKGYATEAIKAVVAYGFEQMNLHSIEAIIDPANSASERVLQKCGFVKEAHFIENEWYNGKFWDSVVYSLLEKNNTLK